jgi:RNA methyltransferase, TrmH family
MPSTISACGEAGVVRLLPVLELMSDSTHATLQDRLRQVTSRNNAVVKELRRAFHEAAPNERGEIAIEGVHLVEEAIRSSLRLTAVFFAESARERAHKLLPQLAKHTQMLLLPDEVFSSAVPTDTPQGVAALVQGRTHSVAKLLRPQPALLVVAAGLQDPGNLGTIARSGEAFGATGLLLAENTVSPWNWKSVRASAGSLFRLPSAKVEMASALAQLREHGISVLATSSHKGTPISEADLKRPIALIIGNEGAGVAKDVLAHVDEVVVIPHSEKVESLNAAIAASLVLYEASRQRKRTFTTEDTEVTEKNNLRA